MFEKISATLYVLLRYLNTSWEMVQLSPLKTLQMFAFESKLKQNVFKIR